MTTKLTTGDLAALTGYTEKQLRNLAESGVLVPENDGEGTGNHRLFSTMQTLGVAFAAQWAQFSTHRKAVEVVCDFLLDMSEEELLAEFEAGRTHLMPDTSGTMHLFEWGCEPEYGECFDVKRAYERVKKKIARLMRDPKNRRVGRGRKRTLIHQ